MGGPTCIEAFENAVSRAGIVDLSYTLESGMPAWPTQGRFSSTVYESYDQGDTAIHSTVTMSEHTGTHIDAPKHFIRGAVSVDKLPLKQVMGRGVYIEASFIEPKKSFSLQNLKDFEKQNGEIKKGDIVMLRFGWDRKYAVQPNSGAFLKDWPGIGLDAAGYLAEKGVAAVGCDCLALDPFDSDNPAHFLLLGKGIPIIENITNLSRLPVFSYVIGLPNKFKDGSGSPIRLIAFVD
ncbi:cyclase [Spirochaetia bacterium]|nr:cyclase [Spirochaetia bacterium]